jgi:hypothetical protein
MAAVPPPTASIAGAQQPERLLPPRMATQLPSDPQTKSHGSRSVPVAV